MQALVHRTITVPKQVLDQQAIGWVTARLDDADMGESITGMGLGNGPVVFDVAFKGLASSIRLVGNVLLLERSLNSPPRSPDMCR